MPKVLDVIAMLAQKVFRRGRLVLGGTPFNDR
jgi:hypothetical protein